MKMRTGFVSNSSSSSFIIGYGVVKNEQKLRKYMKDNKIQFAEITEIDRNSYADIKLFTEYSLWEEDLFLNGGNDTDLKIPEKHMNTNQKVIAVCILNDEGDSMFYDDERDEVNYDRANSIDFYSTEQQKVIELLRDDSILEQSELRFGAERNG